MKPQSTDDPEAELLPELDTPIEKVRWKKYLLAGVPLGLMLSAIGVCFNSERPLQGNVSDKLFFVDAATFRGVALNSGNMNYDVVFNQTLFDCVKNTQTLPPANQQAAKGQCFDNLYRKDPQCRELAKDLVKGTCVGLQACLLNQPYGPIPDPCAMSCAQADPRLFHSCQVQFSALRLLSRTCVPKWIIHDQQTDWRLYQVRDAINGIARRCGKPILNDPFFNS